MMCRMRSEKISAPPPGIESSPASFSFMRTSRGVILPIFEKKEISTIVKALRWTCGKRSFNPEIRSR